MATYNIGFKRTFRWKSPNGSSNVFHNNMVDIQVLNTHHRRPNHRPHTETFRFVEHRPLTSANADTNPSRRMGFQPTIKFIH
ncbi:hypothetical protein J6590_048544 [Homalodisca vitripennis]|nr:hypothetical protein J6590_048544 [Homalodisca vitripennis]